MRKKHTGTNDFSCVSFTNNSFEYSEDSSNNYKNTMNKKQIAVVSIGAIVLICLAILLKSFTIINPGEVGLTIRLGKIVGMHESGLFFRNPFLDQIVVYDIKTQKFTCTTDSYTKDIQTAKLTVVLNYHLTPSKINEVHTNIGRDYQELVIVPMFESTMKDIFGKYEAEQIIDLRMEWSRTLADEMREKLAERGIELEAVDVLDIEYSDAFEKAVEEKQVAQQTAIRTKNETVRIQEEAAQRVIQAKAESEARLVQAEAEAKAMEIKGNSLKNNRDLIRLAAVEKWNGVLPTTVTGPSTGVLLNHNK